VIQESCAELVDGLIVFDCTFSARVMVRVSVMSVFPSLSSSRVFAALSAGIGTTLISRGSHFVARTVATPPLGASVRFSAWIR
jgi:hypothetical protein